jgi:hypothetical protein
MTKKDNTVACNGELALVEEMTLFPAIVAKIIVLICIHIVCI